MIGDVLTPCELAILAFLDDHKGWVDVETLNEQTADASERYDHAAPLRSIGCVRVHIFNIREKLGDGAIICMPDRGYTLGAPGIKAYRAHKAAKEAFNAAMNAA